MVAVTEWRADPGWKLVHYDPVFFPDGAPTSPTPDAELAVPDSWASVYREHRIVATWERFADVGAL